MDPIERTPTEAADYAVLSVLYGALLAGTAARARRRAPIPAAEIPALAAASFALSAGNDLLQSVFSYLCAHATAEQKIAGNPAPAVRFDRVA